MSPARGMTILVTLVVLGVQLSVCSQWRVAGVVVMLIWLWPVAVGLTGLTSLAILAGLLAGVLFDAQSATPFGLSALVGMLLGYAASRLGREGVGDLESAALWVTPVIAGVAGLIAPLLYVSSGVFALDFSLWRYGLVDAMVVNAVAFFFLARPFTRVAQVITKSAIRVRR